MPAAPSGPPLQAGGRRAGGARMRANRARQQRLQQQQQQRAADSDVSALMSRAACSCQDAQLVCTSTQHTVWTNMRCGLPCGAPPCQPALPGMPCCLEMPTSQQQLINCRDCFWLPAVKPSAARCVHHFWAPPSTSMFTCGLFVWSAAGF